MCFIHFHGVWKHSLTNVAKALLEYGTYVPGISFVNIEESMRASKFNIHLIAMVFS